VNVISYHRILYLLSKALKWAGLLSIWIGLIPLIVGVLFELGTLVPFRCPLDESPYLFLIHDWAIGLLYFKLWVRVVTYDLYQSPWRAKFDKVRFFVIIYLFYKVQRDGIVGVNVTEIFWTIIAPILTPLLVSLSVPYFIGFGVIPLFSKLLCKSCTYLFS
jgi:E3 ubiquitin-protein ligase MARCH6